MLSLAPDPVASSADYRRRARRIRANFARDPFLRNRALSDLATQRNMQLQIQPARIQTAARRVPPASNKPTTAAIEKGFSEHVATKLQPFGFTFSDRLKLLDAAERLGIPRFRANMILALHQHQTPGAQSPTTQSPQLLEPTTSIASSILIILAIELLIVATLAWVC